MKRSAALMIAALLSFSVYAQTDGPKIAREETEWINFWGPHTNDSSLPRVLLFGDSITQGYHNAVEKLLEGKANVVRVSGSTSLGDPALMGEIAMVLEAYDFDVVHFNNGMHGDAYSEAEYAAALPALYRLIRAQAPHARIIWANTTAVRVCPDMTGYAPKTERIRERNRLASIFFASRDVLVEDLFEVVGTHAEYYTGSDGVHLNSAGYEAAAAHIASNIEAELARGPYEGVPVEWDVASLAKAPSMTPLPALDHGTVKAALLEGVDWRADKTVFFVYYALPEGADALHPVPAMVLIHGGGGSAYWNWVQKWVDRGYAAIAMANNGQLPVGIEGNPFGKKWGNWALLEGGIHLPCGDFDHALRPYDEQWPYCAVANVMLAHSFLRSLPGVDTTRVGVTGNSWGGFLTLLSAAVDKRYRFAAPVYGCGFFDGFDTHVETTGPAWERWLALWDPCHYIPAVDIPISWACGTNDFYFSFGSLQKSFALARIPPYKAVRSPMVHTDGADEKHGMPAETFALADHFFKGGPDLPKCGDPVLGKKKGKVSVTYDLCGREVQKVELLYLTACEGPWEKRKWHSAELPLPRRDGMITTVVPEGAKILFFNLTTSDGLVSSSTAISL